MHSFEVHSNESACRKSGRLGLEQVYTIIFGLLYIVGGFVHLYSTKLFGPRIYIERAR